MIAIPAKMQPSREKGAQMAGYLRWSGVLLVMLQFAVAGAAGARAQETNQMVQSVVQNVRDSVQYRIREDERRTAALTAPQPDCLTCTREAETGKNKRDRRH